MAQDHSGITNSLQNPPSEGFLANLRHTLECLLITVVRLILRIVLIVVLYLIWIPLVIWAFGWFLQL